MARNIPGSTPQGSGNFRKVVVGFLSGEELPFARILSAERVKRVFAKHNGLFGRNGIYSTAMVLGPFLGQVLRDGKEASCQAAVARVVAHCQQEQIAPPTADTGDYCRAREKLSKRRCRNSAAKWPPKWKRPPRRIGCGRASTPS